MRMFRALLLTAILLAAADTEAAPADVVGNWTFVGQVSLPDGQVVTVRGRLGIQAGGTMILTDDGVMGRGLSEATQAALAQKGVRLQHGPALGEWALSRGVFVFRVTAFVHDANDPLGRAIGSRVIQGRGRFDARRATWTFTEGWPAKWTGPDLDAGKNEIAIESIEIAHEGWDGSG